jgi:hypothetical protein
MARNAAVRKAAKAIRRKAVVAAKRHAEVAAGSLGGRVRTGATQPILQCLVSDRLFDLGIGVVVLTRGVSREYQHVGVFMLDTFCLGVKDGFFRNMDREQADFILQSMQSSDPVSPIPPAEARKLLRDLTAWASRNGFPPHKDYAVIETLFGGVAPAETDYTPRFGHGGEVLYVPGPTESPTEVRRRLKTVRSRFGDASADRGILALASAFADDLEPEMDDDED